MCISNGKGSCITVQLIPEDSRNNRWTSGAVQVSSGRTLYRRWGSFLDERHVKEDPPQEMKKSFSFGGLGVLPLEPSEDLVSQQELEECLDSESRAPSRSTKEQIKKYAKKYSYIQKELHLAEEKHARHWSSELLELTQPAHLIAIVSVMYLAFRLFPDKRRPAGELSTLTRLLYVMTVSWVFGNQMWMTFVSGLGLFFSVPRHVFSQVQSVLFPLYFLTNSGLLLVAIVTYTQLHPTHMWDGHQCMQEKDDVLLPSSTICINNGSFKGLVPRGAASDLPSFSAAVTLQKLVVQVRSHRVFIPLSKQPSRCHTHSCTPSKLHIVIPSERKLQRFRLSCIVMHAIEGVFSGSLFRC